MRHFRLLKFVVWSMICLRYSTSRRQNIFAVLRMSRDPGEWRYNRQWLGLSLSLPLKSRSQKHSNAVSNPKIWLLIRRHSRQPRDWSKPNSTKLFKYPRSMSVPSLIAIGWENGASTQWWNYLKHPTYNRWITLLTTKWKMYFLYLFQNSSYMQTT